MTLVSIVTPSFNQAAYLEQAICSVLDQSYREFEYMVVDGGSTDGSLDIIRKYASRLAWWTSSQDQGQADAINQGMRRARGEIVAWLNSDDYYLPGALQGAVEALAAHPGAAMIYGDMLAVDQDGRTINSFRYRQLRLEDLLCFQIIGQPAVFMRRAAFERSGGLELSLNFLLDHQLWLRIASQGEMIHIPQTWAAARYHPRAKNLAQATGFGREAFRILDWAAQEPALRPAWQRVEQRARAAAHRVDARYLLDDGQSWPALRAWTRALALHPPTALARLNIFGSALLNLCGLGGVRRAALERRSRRLTH